jgi:hypothetical protein
VGVQIAKDQPMLALVARGITPPYTIYEVIANFNPTTSPRETETKVFAVFWQIK